MESQYMMKVLKINQNKYKNLNKKLIILLKI